MYISLERKCVREDPSVGGNVKNRIAHSLCGLGFVMLSPTPGSSRAHFLLSGIFKDSLGGKLIFVNAGLKGE